MNDKELLGNIWFSVRWATGYLLDLFITIGGATAMVWSFVFYLRYPLRDIPWFSNQTLSSPLIAFGVAVGIFSAFMAGRQWARTQYFTHILPEVWSDTVRSFIESAKKQEQEDKKED